MRSRDCADAGRAIGALPSLPILSYVSGEYNQSTT